MRYRPTSFALPIGKTNSSRRDSENDSGRWAPPADVEELIARITPGEEAHFALDYVEFTGDSDAVAELRKRDPYGKYASDLWDYVRV